MQRYGGEEQLIKNNKMSQSALWSFGISGDFPILLFRLHDETNVALLRVLVCAHQQWHLQGLTIDFVIMHEGSSGYIDEINSRVQQLLQEIGVGSTSWATRRGTFCFTLIKYPLNREIFSKLALMPF